jgi:hypothetical protein
MEGSIKIILSLEHFENIFGKHIVLYCIALLLVIAFSARPLYAAGPALEISKNIHASSGSIVSVPVTFKANGNNISAVIFSVDYDETILSFDPADNNNDGIPDAITFTLSAGFNGSIAFNSNDTNGELDFMIMDVSPPLDSLRDGDLVSIRMTTGSPRKKVTKAIVGFSNEPVASFGSTTGQSVKGSIRDGDVQIKEKGR